MQLANTLANIGCNNIIPTKYTLKSKLKSKTHNTNGKD